MLGLSWLGVSAAFAWSVGELRPVEAPGETIDVELLRWDGRGAVAWAVQEGLRVVSVDDGSELLAVDGALAAVTSHDLDGDGATDLVLCGPGGLSWVRASTGRAERLGERSCDDVVVVVPEGGHPGLVVRSELALFAWTSDGGPIREVPLEERVSARPMTAWRGGWAAVAPGRRGVRVGQGPVRGSLDSDDEVREIAWGPDGWTWRTADGRLVSAVGSSPAPEGAEALVGAVLSGRRTLLVGVPSDGRVGLLADGLPPVSVQVPVRPDRLVVGDVDGDACADWLVVSDSGSGALVLGACATSASPSPPSRP